MRIDTERLSLRPLSIDCLRATHSYASDPENTRYMVNLPVDSVGETEDFIRRAEEQWRRETPEYLEFAVFRGEEQIGGATCFFQNDKEGELGWILRRDCQGQGYAREAVEALMDYIRREWGIHRFVAHCDSENAGSYRLMERLGMRCTGRCGGRKNRLSDEERTELTYEIRFPSEEDA